MATTASNWLGTGLRLAVCISTVTLILSITTHNHLDPQRGHLITKEQKKNDGKALASYTYTVNTLGQCERVVATPPSLEGVSGASPPPSQMGLRHNTHREPTQATTESAKQWDYT